MSNPKTRAVRQLIFFPFLLLLLGPTALAQRDSAFWSLHPVLEASDFLITDTTTQVGLRKSLGDIFGSERCFPSEPELPALSQIRMYDVSAEQNRSMVIMELDQDYCGRSTGSCGPDLYLLNVTDKRLIPWVGQHCAGVWKIGAKPQNGAYPAYTITKWSEWQMKMVFDGDTFRETEIGRYLVPMNLYHLLPEKLRESDDYWMKMVKIRAITVSPKGEQFLFVSLATEERDPDFPIETEDDSDREINYLIYRLTIPLHFELVGKLGRYSDTFEVTEKTTNGYFDLLIAPEDLKITYSWDGKSYQMIKPPDWPW